MEEKEYENLEKRISDLRVEMENHIESARQSVRNWILGAGCGFSITIIFVGLWAGGIDYRMDWVMRKSERNAELSGELTSKVEGLKVGRDEINSRLDRIEIGLVELNRNLNKTLFKLKGE